MSVYVAQIRATGGFFFIYLITTYHYITVCNNGDKENVLTKLIARTRFSDFNYLFSEINVYLSIQTKSTDCFNSFQYKMMVAHYNYQPQLFFRRQYV